jgi:hypothetical protein
VYLQTPQRTRRAAQCPPGVPIRWDRLASAAGATAPNAATDTRTTEHNGLAHSCEAAPRAPTYYLIHTRLPDSKARRSKRECSAVGAEIRHPRDSSGGGDPLRTRRAVQSPPGPGVPIRWAIATRHSPLARTSGSPSEVPKAERRPYIKAAGASGGKGFISQICGLLALLRRAAKRAQKRGVCP